MIQPGDSSIHSHSYELELGRGTEFLTPDDDSIIIVQYSEGRGASLTWPTELTPVEFFQRAIAKLPLRPNLPPDKFEVFCTIPGRDTEVAESLDNLSDFRRDSDNPTQSIHFFDASSGVNFGWQAPFLEHGMEGGMVIPARATVPSSMLETLLHETGAGTLPDYSRSLAIGITSLLDTPRP